MTSKIATSKIVEVYRQVAKFPTPTGAFGRFNDHGFELETTWSQRDLEKKETTKFLRNFIIPGASPGLWKEREKDNSERYLCPVGLPVDISNEIWRVHSDAGEKLAILRKGSGEQDKEEKQVLEVWNRTSRLVTVEVTAQEKHGKIYGDDHVFGSLQFSKCEKYLLYIAEKKRPKFESFFEPFGKTSANNKSDPTEGSSSSSSSSPKAIKGSKHSFVEEWGEQLVGKSHPVICLLDIESGIVKVLDDDGDYPVIPSTLSAGQAIWVPPITPKTKPSHKSYFRPSSPAAPVRPSIVFVGFDHSVERLGIIYCPIRPSALYVLDVADILAHKPGNEMEKEVSNNQVSEDEAVAKKPRLDVEASTEPITSSTSSAKSFPKARQFGPSGSSVRSPRFNPDGTIMVFLENPVGGPHFQCSKLMAFERKADQQIDECGPAVVIWDIKHGFPKRDFRGSLDYERHSLFNRELNRKNAITEYGIYSVSLPTYCFEAWEENSVCWIIRANSIVDHFNAVLRIDVTRRELVETVTDNNPVCLGVFSDVAVNLQSESSNPGHISVDRLTRYEWEVCSREHGFDYYDGERPQEHKTIFYDNLVPQIGDALTFTAMLHLPKSSNSRREDNQDESDDEADGASQQQCSCAKSPKQSPKFPLIVFPHGGPHSAFTDAWSTFVYGFLQLGFAVLKVNYRGSVGCGQNSIESLPGHVGDYDVKDVHQAATHALQDQSAVLDASKVVIFGGSHGGFLTAHSIGQYPDFYRSAVCRNPVINLANMLGVTDIPDWTYVEGVEKGAGMYEAGVVPTPEHLKQLISRSPIAHAHKVKAPTLIMIGLKDLRVPPSQGMQFYRALKARGVEVDLKAFPEDNHTLGRLETEAECFVLIARWFLKHLNMLDDGN